MLPNNDPCLLNLHCDIGRLRMAREWLQGTNLYSYPSPALSRETREIFKLAFDALNDAISAVDEDCAHYKNHLANLESTE